MDLRQLRYFVAVAEELHFGRAAERVGIAQPPLTQQIQRLEKDLGSRLLIRHTRKTTLTEAGEVLLAQARLLLRDFDDAIDRTRRAARGETGQLTVGTPPSMMLTALPRVIRKYRARYPQVHFTLREQSTTAIAQGLAAGSIDVGFLREAAPTGDAVVEFRWQEPLVAVLPAAHPLAKRAQVKLADLANEPFVLFPRSVGDALYDKIIGLCVKAGFTPRVVQEATQWQSVVACVETGMGVSVAPACVERFRWKGVAYRPLAGLKTAVAVCRSGNRATTTQAFLQYVTGEFCEE